tara:strand:- start:691 stop:1305 length:615 start_codon:yes stop_codon:yes gene_type:complete
MKPLLCLICVGKYTDALDTYIPIDKQKELEKMFDICLLTDNENINGLFDIEFYREKIFTYFAKLTFPIRMAIKHKRGAYYCDINKLHELANVDVDNEYKFTYIREWPKLTYFKQMENEMYWRKLVWFWVSKGYDWSLTKTIEEHAYYMPYHKQSENLLYTIEEIKPIFEYISITNKNDYANRGIGNGEGLALSYALEVNNIEKA